MKTSGTIQQEDRYAVTFLRKMPVSVARGAGVHVWDEDGNRYLDFTSGLGVTCLGHAHPVITDALLEQGGKIIQNPYGGRTYSPARARLLSLMREILPEPLVRVFFANSGAEANDAAIKLARKAAGRPDVIAMQQGFHGRTISTASATGQAKYRDRFNPLMPNYRFVPFDDVGALKKALDGNVAALIMEPVQGEGGVIIPSDGYLEEVGRVCRANGTLLIVDEIQTGFCRTGPMFATGTLKVEADFMTMGKGIAGGFPFAAFAVTENVAARFEAGDHGGTYCGNPLGCAVAHAVIGYLLDHDISGNVMKMGALALDRLRGWQRANPALIKDVRGRGLLLAMEFHDAETAGAVTNECLARGLFVWQTQGKMIRISPPLNILREEMEEGLTLLGEAMDSAMRSLADRTDSVSNNGRNLL